MTWGRNYYMKGIFALYSVLFFLSACDITIRHSDEGMQNVSVDSLAAYDSIAADSVNPIKTINENENNRENNTAIADNTRNIDITKVKPGEVIDTKDVHPLDVVNFAKTLIGIPYRYGSTDPKVGFDCSGFITYVFNHFKITVPRSSIDFTNVGREIPVASAKSGDIILFTGTDSTERFVGHMGIVVSNTDTLRFIHSTSGKQYGVTITPFNKYYRGRFVKTIQLFKRPD